jgi:protein disulfide-isomerase A6
VNCDEDANKQFCGSMGIKGFPTLKIVKPGKKSGSPVVEDYNGPREAKDIVEALMGKIPNHVKKVVDKDLESFLAEANETAKAILFTEKGTTSALLKAVAVDFLGSIKVAQIRSKETASVELFGITKFPTILLLPPGKEAQGIIYDGEMKKDKIVEFLSQTAPPNPDPAPPKAKTTKPKEDKKAAKSEKVAKESFKSASASHESSEASASAASATTETLEQNTPPTESPDPIVEPTPSSAPVELIPPLPVLPLDGLTKTCLGEKASTCVLALVPASYLDSPAATQALNSLSEIVHRHDKSGRKIFPIYVFPSDGLGFADVKKGLGLTNEVEIVAVNRKRGWWRHFGSEGSEPTIEKVENWIDAIRMGDGVKKEFPEGLMPQKVASEAAGKQPLENQKPIAEEKAAPPIEEATPEPTLEPEPHDEL